MYSVLFSKIDIGFPYVVDKLKEIINPNSKVVIIPWSFTTETNAIGLENYFSKERKKKYIDNLKKLGIKDQNISVLNCYADSKEYMQIKIKEADVLVLPGGNPEMFYNKVVSANILNDIKKFKKIIIGSSAGTELQLNNYL